MARLEIELAGVNDDLKRVLKESKIELSNFSKGLDFNTKGVTRVNDTLSTTGKLLKGIIADAAKANSVFKNLNTTNVAASLTAQRIATEAARTEAAKYRAEIAKLNGEIKAQRLAQEAANLATANGRTDAQNARVEAARHTAEINRLRLANVQNRQATVGASGSYREAQQRLTALGRSIREAQGGFNSSNPVIRQQITEYRNLNRQLTAFDAQLGNHQRNVGNYQSALNGLKGLALQYFGFTALLAGGRAVLMNNAKISDSLGDVRRTASLTSKEADALAKALKGIDTRTNLVDLLGIATIGGQLGIAKDQLAGFTEAIDQLSVALGGELAGGAEGVAKSLGVLDNVFGVTTSNSGNVKLAYNQIGSAILALGQEGLATGDFLADFGERVGGIAKQAGIALPTVLAFGAVLQENGVSAEVAGTSFKKLISALANNSEKFFQVAKFGDANLTLKEFNTLVNTDTKKALDLLFNGLRKGGESTIAFNTILKQLKLSQSGISQSVAALVAGQGNLNKYIALGTEEFNKATLAGDQFAIKNETLAASLDKLRNSIANITTDSAFANWIKGFIDNLTRGVNKLSEFSDKITKLREDIAISSRSGILGATNILGISDAEYKKALQSRRNRNTEALNDEIKGQGSSKADILAAGKSEAQIRRLLTGEIYKQNEAAKRLNHTLAYIKNPKNVLGPLDAQKSKVNKLRADYAKQAAVVDRLRTKLSKPVVVRSDEQTAISLGGAKTPKTKSVPKDYANEIAQVAAKATNFEALLLSDGVEATNEKTRQKYAKLNAELDTIQKGYAAKYKGNNDKIKQLDSDLAASRKLINLNSENEIAKNNLEFAQKKADIIAGIEEKAGVVREVSQEQELQQNDIHYKELERKYKDHADILNAISNARVVSDEQINQKWIAKRAEAEQKIFDKIQSLSEKEYTANVNNTAKGRAVIERQLAENLAKYKKYFDELKKMNANSGLAQLGLGVGNAVIANNEKGKADAAKNPVAQQVKEQLKYAVQSFGQDFTNTLRNINQQADKSFGAIVGNLAGSLTSQLENVFDNQLKNILGNLIDGVKINTGQAVSALAGIAGGLVSGITKSTSSIGQAAGGALSGGATGFMLGGPIGAGIGALLGGIGGLFKASKARKEEALQKAQLEEQKKQTALMERQNALTYASQIIGRQTVNGVITGIEVNEFGQLTTYVSGSNLAIVLDRADGNRQRGR